MEMSEWRVGQHYGIHVYEDETPVCTAMTPEFAAQIVRDHNAAFSANPRTAELEEEVARLNEQVAQWWRQNSAIIAAEVSARKRAETAERERDAAKRLDAAAEATSSSPSRKRRTPRPAAPTCAPEGCR
jgi:hypothetical protein